MAAKRTIADIARLAGVSKATVSRVLNHKPDVDSATRERILRIVEEEGYVPSITASHLAGGRSSLIGVIIPSFTWPFISEFMRGVAEVIVKTQYELVLYCINDTVQESHRKDVIEHILVTQLTGGILAILPGQSGYDILRLHRNGLPVVTIDDQQLPSETAWIGVDNQGGAYTAVCHLIKLGHQRIAHIQGPMRYLCSRERYQGYLQAMEEADLAVDPALVLEGEFVESSGRRAANQFFSMPPEQRPTAIFAGNDLTAFGVITTAEEFGVCIPDDVALVGFDDLALAAHVRPALTTIRQPFVEMGRQGIELLLTMLNKPKFVSAKTAVSAPPGGIPRAEARNPIRMYLPTDLVVRTSCGSSLQQFSTDNVS